MRLVQKNLSAVYLHRGKIDTRTVLGGSFVPLTGNNHRVVGTYKQVMYDESNDVVKFFKMPSVEAKVIKYKSINFDRGRQAWKQIGRKVIKWGGVN